METAIEELRKCVNYWEIEPMYNRVKNSLNNEENIEFMKRCEIRFQTLYHGSQSK